jgi:hypothetical protein
MPDPLEVAHQVKKEQFNGWTYGSDAKARKIDCVQFVKAVLTKCLARELSPDERRALCIDHGFTDLNRTIESGDKRIRGVHYLLVDLMGKGESVSMDQVMAGDFIQYWMKKSNGTWFGHSAIVSEVIKDPAGPKIRIFGAHKSINGIGDSKFLLDLKGANRKIYIARLKINP